MCYYTPMDLKQWIETSDYSVKKLSDELGVSLALIYYWIKGDRTPSGKNMNKLISLSNNAIDANTFYK